MNDMNQWRSSASQRCQSGSMLEGLRGRYVWRQLVCIAFLCLCATCAVLASPGADAVAPPEESAYDIFWRMMTNPGAAHSLWLYAQSNNNSIATNFPPGMTEYDLMVEPDLKKLLPAEYDAFEEGLRVTPLVDSAHAALLLTQRAADLAGR
jgi:hypothetical protein